MSRVLAMLDDSPLASGVLRTATAFARLLHAEVDAVTVVNGVNGDRSPGSSRHESPVLDVSPRIVHGIPAVELRTELEAPDVVVGVLGTRTVLSHPQLLGHIAQAVATGSSTALVLVPPGCRLVSVDHPVFLLPLDGDARTSESVAPIAEMLASHGGRIVALHVFDSTTVPMFSPSQRNDPVLAHEFLARNAPGSAHRAEVRIGQPAHHILDAAQEYDVDAIVLAWKQELGSGRAEIVRRVVTDAAVPVVLASCR